MLLWLEEGIKVPERTLNEIVCRHFRETGGEEENVTIINGHTHLPEVQLALSTQQPLTHFKTCCNHENFKSLANTKLKLTVFHLSPFHTSIIDWEHIWFWNGSQLTPFPERFV